MLPIETEPFIGMWRDREEMADGTAWVRRLRACQWSRADTSSGPAAPVEDPSPSRRRSR